MLGQGLNDHFQENEQKAEDTFNVVDSDDDYDGIIDPRKISKDLSELRKPTIKRTKKRPRDETSTPSPTPPSSDGSGTTHADSSLKALQDMANSLLGPVKDGPTAREKFLQREKELANEATRLKLQQEQQQQTQAQQQQMMNMLMNMMNNNNNNNNNNDTNKTLS